MASQKSFEELEQKYGELKVNIFQTKNNFWTKKM